MKNVALVISVTTFLTLGAYLYMSKESVTEYEAPTTEEVMPTDNVSEAQKQLNEAKRLLAEEEETLLSEIDEREARLEEIRSVRLSFSQAPEQVR